MTVTYSESFLQEYYLIRNLNLLQAALKAAMAAGDVDAQVAG